MDSAEAEQMQALLTGYVFAKLRDVGEILRAPLVWQDLAAGEPIRFTLASGALVTVSVTVEASGG